MATADGGHQRTDFNFQFCWIPNTYPARVQRASVLYPLMGMARSVDEIAEKTRRLIEWWRVRAALLHQAGWYRGAHPGFLVFARNCCPSFAHTTPPSRPCKHPEVCPFCWSRWVQDVWERIDRVFPNPRRGVAGYEYHPFSQRRRSDIVEPDLPIDPHIVPAKGPRDVNEAFHGRALRTIQLNEEQESTGKYHLIERSKITIFPFKGNGYSPEGWLRHLMEKFVHGRTLFVRRCHPHGAFSFAIFLPCSQGWALHSRMLLMVTPEFSASEEVLAEARIERHKKPTRRIIFHAVAHACRYPKRLMRGEVERVVMVLNARRGRREPHPVPAVRLSATYGAFRLQST